MSKKTIAVISTGSLAVFCDFIIEPSLLVYVCTALVVLFLPYILSKHKIVKIRNAKSENFDVTGGRLSRDSQPQEKFESVYISSPAEEWSRPADLSTAHIPSAIDALPQLSGSLDTQMKKDTRHIGTIKSCSAQNGYGSIVCGNFERDLIFSMTALTDAEVVLARPGKVVHFDVCEHENGTRAQNIKFFFEGLLKSFDAVRNHGFIRCPGSSDVWFGRSDVVTVNPSLTAGSSVRFELYYGGNGKPRARRVEIGTVPNVLEGVSLLGRVKSFKDSFCFVTSELVNGDVFLGKEEIPDDWDFLQVGVPLRFRLVAGSEKPKACNVKMLVMTFRNACVKTYNPASHYGFISCDGLDEDVWFAEASLSRPKDSKVPQVEDSSRTFDLQSPAPGTPVKADIFQRGDGQLRAFRVSPLVVNNGRAI